MQLPPFGQGKFVQCVQGAIRDFILDPRPESPDFGKFIEIELDEDGDKAIWVPSELAHGFLATQDETIVVYSVTENWSRQHERTIQPKSTALSDVLDFDALVLSHKDRAAPSLATVAAELAALTQA